MIDAADRGSELVTSRGASVSTRYDRRLCARIDIRTEDGMPAARAGAGLVRQAVVDASARGLLTAELSLDVAAPVSGAVLEQLHDLVDDGVASLEVRRAGGTVLVEVHLTPRSTGRDGDAQPGCAMVAGATRSRTRRQTDREPARRLGPD